jgi:4a-hydroxytetrahydrobiopterin dehydratase
MNKPNRVPLTPAKINVALGALSGWTYADNRLSKTFTFKTFRDALAFIVRLGFEAEAMDHHPELTNVYNKVSLALNTHDAGGKVTAKDVELAKRIEQARAVMV